MSPRSIGLSDTLYDYLLDVSLREPDILRRLREETAELPMARMQIAPEQGQFMRLVTELIGAHRYLEVGTFTGYSSLSVALAQPEDGEIVCCDVDEDYTAVARRYWEEAGVSRRIRLHLAPARQTLASLLDDGATESFDFIFIDADKENYDAYYEFALRLLRPGGLVAIDNVLWDGKVVDLSKDDPDTTALRALNRKLRDDERISLSLLPLGDGLSLCRKR